MRGPQPGRQHDHARNFASVHAGAAEIRRGHESYTARQRRVRGCFVGGRTLCARGAIDGSSVPRRRRYSRYGHGPSEAKTSCRALMRRSAGREALAALSATWPSRAERGLICRQFSAATGRHAKDGAVAGERLSTTTPARWRQAMHPPLCALADSQNLRLPPHWSSVGQCVWTWVLPNATHFRVFLNKQ